MMHIPADIKKQLFSYCLEYLEQKRNSLQAALQMAREAVADDGKSTAGDKHETGRAMAQLEQEKLSGQFQELEKAQQVLDQIDPSIENTKIKLGSVVFTSNGNYFIAISAGKKEIDSAIFFIVSPNSPIGQALINSNGKELNFNSSSFAIQQAI
ncbi:MAG: 3-oxoacyl-ACP synthase [Bacteroidetes bacterium]|nr:3-oxoacyl-ACP synthase [Bacteroidota bacterium]